MGVLLTVAESPVTTGLHLEGTERLMQVRSEYFSILDRMLTFSVGYGAPDAGYGAPDAGYGAPDAGEISREIVFLFDPGMFAEGYGAPDAGYGAPADSGYNPGSSYDSPDAGYSAPQSGYSRGRRAVSLTRDQKSLYDLVRPQTAQHSPLLASLALRAPLAPAVQLAQLS